MVNIKKIAEKLENMKKEFRTKKGQIVKNNISKDIHFQLLTSAEERKLTIEERKEYYKQLREYVKQRKPQVTTPGATTLGPILKKPTNTIARAVTKLFVNKDVEWVCDGQENIPEEAAIFAHTHQGILDNFVWIPTIDRHCLLLHGAEVNKLLLLAQMNTGLVLVKKEDKQNNLDAKLDMIRHLTDGHSIVYFPEGTWNLSPNKLHLPMRHGFLDIARKANVPVVPVVHEYTYDTTGERIKIAKIHTRYGTPIYISPEDDIQEKLEEYEEAISTLKFELMEEKGLFRRDEVDNSEYAKFLKESHKNLALGQLDWDKETRSIFGAGNDPFHYINDVPVDESGEFVDTPEVKRLRLINQKNGIGKRK